MFRPVDRNTLIFSVGLSVKCSLLIKPTVNAHADVSSRARGLHIGLSDSRHVYTHPYFVYASSKSSDCAGLSEPSLLTNAIRTKSGSTI